MKIAVTATGNTLDSSVDPRFGRCPNFLIVETDDLSFEVVDNPNVSLGGGAGIQSAQFMADRGVTHVLTGNCGPNAYKTLSAAGVAVIVGCSGPVRQAVEQFKAGRLSPVEEPNVASHFGMGGGAPMPPGPEPGVPHSVPVWAAAWAGAEGATWAQWQSWHGNGRHDETRQRHGVRWRPGDRRVAEAYSRGEMACDAVLEYR